MYYRTNLMLRQIALLVQDLDLRCGPRGGSLGATARAFIGDPLLIVDDTLVPTYERLDSASLKNYRYSVNT
ncbi:hypothetical protein GCM10010428_51490 [Actinosynnema pretiosum subsp. pretiosum]